MITPARRLLLTLVLLVLTLLCAHAQDATPSGQALGTAFRLERMDSGAEAYTPMSTGRHSVAFGGGIEAGTGELISFDTGAVSLLDVRVPGHGDSGSSVAALSLPPLGYGLEGRGIALTVAAVPGPKVGRQGQRDGMGITGPVWAFGPAKLRFTDPATLTLDLYCQ